MKSIPPRATTDRRVLKSKYPSLDVALWARVVKGDGCWLWAGTTYRHGYGTFVFRNKRYASHRVAYTVTFGPFPQHFYVLHTCDNPPCCNPDHLFLGTQLENMRDMLAKGRGKIYCNSGRTYNPGTALYESVPRGERHSNAKLTEAAVREIRAAYVRGAAPALAAKYGVDASLIGLVVRRKLWAHVD